tara:strand:- start:21 stop:626 length:606 start_codon:yes stop_codon:yes gene_type:complete
MRFELRKRDSQKSISHILDVAAAIFIKNGKEGARIDDVAHHSKFNKALIYHYFKNKDDLYAKTLMNILGKIKKGYKELPPSLDDALLFWLNKAEKSKEIIKIMLRDSLEDKPLGLKIIKDILNESYEFGEEEIRKKKEEGLIDQNIDERYLLFLITCIIITPYSFPRLTKSIVGVSPYSKSFKDNFSRILTQFAKGLKDVS